MVPYLFVVLLSYTQGKSINRIEEKLQFTPAPLKSRITGHVVIKD